MRPPRPLLASLALGLAVTGAGSTARAADPPAENKLHWDERWPRFRPAELVATGVLGALATEEYWLVPPQPHPRWTQGNAFDDRVRNALHLHDPGALHTVWALADIVDISLVVLVVGFDSAVVPLLRGSPDVAWQVSLMDYESFALSSVLTFTLYDTVGRARPNYADCQRNPKIDSECGISPTASFPSGHVNEAFTVAGLSCAHHTMLPLYGNRFLDVLACARDMLFASADGVLRIMGDRHYATDVLAGGGIGFAFGYGLPMLLHYGMRTDPRSGAWTLAPLGGDRIGLALVGSL